jgi:hypothetical protein
MHGLPAKCFPSIFRCVRLEGHSDTSESHLVSTDPLPPVKGGVQAEDVLPGDI